MGNSSHYDLFFPPQLPSFLRLKGACFLFLQTSHPLTGYSTREFLPLCILGSLVFTTAADLTHCSPCHSVHNTGQFLAFCDSRDELSPAFLGLLCPSLTPCKLIKCLETLQVPRQSICLAMYIVCWLLQMGHLSKGLVC